MEILSWRKKIRRLCLVLGSLCILSLPASSSARAEVSLEYKVKAAFLVNFIKFIEWPSGGKDAATVCIYGDNPFGDYVAGILKNSIDKGRILVVAEGSELQGNGCNVAFSNKGDFGRLAKDSPILTVADTGNNAGIVFKVVNNKVKFIVNADVLATRGLKVSSKLLALSLHE